MVLTAQFPRGSCRRLAACCLLSAAFAAAAAIAQEPTAAKTVEVVGTAPFSESDPAAAREKAIAKGLEAAVLQAAADRVPADLFERSSAAIRAALAPDTQRYIESYQVVEEGRTEEGYRVVVRAAVSARLIDAELLRANVLQPAEELPAVLFLTSQQDLGDVTPRYWWSGTARDEELAAENAMMRILGDNGFRVIGRGAPGVGPAAASLRFTPDPGDREAADLGIRLGAEVVVVGQSAAEAEPAGRGGGARSFKAATRIRALEVGSGEVLAAAAESVAAPRGDERAGGPKALAGAGEQAGRTLAALLRPAWLNRKKGSGHIRLEVEGTRALADFVRFRKALQTTEGVRGIRIEELKADEAVLAVDFDGDTRTLAARLTGPSHTAFGIDITGLSGQHLRLRLARSAGAM